MSIALGATALKGATVLVVAANVFAAAELDLFVDDAGGRAVALVVGAEAAVRMIEVAAVDAVVIDGSLEDGDVAALGRRLSARGIEWISLSAAPPV